MDAKASGFEWFDGGNGQLALNGPDHPTFVVFPRKDGQPGFWVAQKTQRGWIYLSAPDLEAAKRTAEFGARWIKAGSIHPEQSFEEGMED